MRALVVSSVCGMLFLAASIICIQNVSIYIVDDEEAKALKGGAPTCVNPFTVPCPGTPAGCVDIVCPGPGFCPETYGTFRLTPNFKDYTLDNVGYYVQFPLQFDSIWCGNKYICKAECILLGGSAWRCDNNQISEQIYRDSLILPQNPTECP